MSLRVEVRAEDPIRRRGLAAMLAGAGFVLAHDAPDVVLCDDAAPGAEVEAPVVALTDRIAPPDAAGVLPRAAQPCQIQAALRAAAVGLVVRLPGASPLPGFRGADDSPALTTREAEVLAAVGLGLSNKAIARRLAISVHTVKFHLEALFQKIGATSRAEAVAKGLRQGIMEL
ncbi:MAG: response regulator transcription factor [Acetobacteraceae bacterium]